MGEELGWTKDTTPYLVFPCEKCGQYLFVKQSGQLTKKCVRPHCGRSHQVNTIKNAQVVVGITAAKDTVKKMQHQLALRELGSSPDFHADHEFMVLAEVPPPKEITTGAKPELSESELQFANIIKKISQQYTEFPEYALELMTPEATISKAELKALIHRFVQQKVLIPLKNGYFKVNRTVF